MKITKIMAVAKACTATLLLLALLFYMSGCVKDELTTGLTIENSTTTDDWTTDDEYSGDDSGEASME